MVTRALFFGGSAVVAMKQVHDQSLQTKEEPKDVKVDLAAEKFVEMFRRAVVERRKETLTHG